MNERSAYGTIIGAFCDQFDGIDTDPSEARNTTAGRDILGLADSAESSICHHLLT
jgi:hypothetical protein